MRFIHVNSLTVVHVHCSVILLCICILQFIICWWTFDCSHFLTISNNAVRKFIPISLCAVICWVYIYPTVNLLGYRPCVYLSFVDIASFPEWLWQFTFPWTVYKSSHCSISSLTTGIVSFYFCYSDGCETAFVVLIFISWCLFYGVPHGLSWRIFHLCFRRMCILLLDRVFSRCLLGLIGL